MRWLQAERGLDLADYDALWRWSVTDLEGFWSSLWDFFEVRAHTPYERVLGSRVDARRGVVPGRTAELRRAHARRRRRAGRGGGRRVLADARAVRAHVRRAPRAGGARPCRAAAARDRRGRPRGRVPAEHPGDARRVPRLRQPRRDLGDVPARVRRAQRPRPPRPARAEAAACRRGLRWGERLVDRREQVAEVRRRAAEPRGRRRGPVPGARARRRRLLGASSSPTMARSSSSRCRSRTRSTSCSPRARPASRRRSCTATAGSCSSTRRTTRSAGT